MRLLLKLPDEVVMAHGDVISGWDWRAQWRMRLADTLPESPDLADVVLEGVARGDSIVVRATTARGAIQLRRYAQSLAPMELIGPEVAALGPQLSRRLST